MLMQEMRPLCGPCSCTCHDYPGTLHMVPCCNYAHAPRALATARAKILQGPGATATSGDGKPTVPVSDMPAKS